MQSSSVCGGVYQLIRSDVCGGVLCRGSVAECSVEVILDMLWTVYCVILLQFYV